MLICMVHLLDLERRLYISLRAHADRKAARRADRNPNPTVRPKPEHLLTGERGEAAAFFHLRSLGYTIVARRWRSRRLPGDLDLIAWDGPTLVIFEIKTRTAHDLAPAESQVDRHKQDQLRRMAAAYLRRIPETHRASIPLRFDVLSVYLLPTGPNSTQTEFEHLRNAFPQIAPPRPKWR
jgi:putative endonuclease